ncbi:hypothetical protein JB92DRAFT_1482050 [Gautieria morchelliformis]|nr:hypothetical protein JB92DRAFT_1482050 [Gautieria morchelliformis]
MTHPASEKFPSQVNEGTGRNRWGFGSCSATRPPSTHPAPGAPASPSTNARNATSQVHKGAGRSAEGIVWESFPLRQKRKADPLPTPHVTNATSRMQRNHDAQKAGEAFGTANSNM